MNKNRSSMRLCPKCGKQYSDHPALSREDGSTEICPECGQQEALEAYRKHLRDWDASHRQQPEN